MELHGACKRFTDTNGMSLAWDGLHNTEDGLRKRELGFEADVLTAHGRVMLRSVIC